MYHLCMYVYIYSIIIIGGLVKGGDTYTYCMHINFISIHTEAAELGLLQEGSN